MFKHLWHFRIGNVVAALAACCGLPLMCFGQVPPLLKVGDKPDHLPGLHNVFAVTEKLINGSSPEGDEGFAALKKLGVKTILSVDGAQPDLDRAKKYGMRYVHLPMGYDGVSQEQALKLAKAVRDLPGPIYLHCHHGKHRSPGAAAAILYCLDESCTAAQAVEVMKRAGTDPRYVGLYGAPKELRRPTTAELDKLRIDLPEKAKLPALAEAMVRIDHHWDNLTAIRKAGWKVPKDHPDLDPPHEALQLWEHYRELARAAAIKERPADFRAWLAGAENAAFDLERALRKVIRAEEAEKSFQASRQSCGQCHGKYRDVPQAK